MATIERFEELQCWQKARQLANDVYDLSSHSLFSKDYQLSNQVRAAAGSIMHNIAEGFESGSRPEFVRFLKIARRSASEVQSELYLAVDRSYISADDLHRAYELATDVKRLINGLVGYLRKPQTRTTTELPND